VVEQKGQRRYYFGVWWRGRTNLRVK